MTVKICPEVGAELFNYLHEQVRLTKLLTEGKDEDGDAIVSIHRGHVPQYDRMISELSQCSPDQVTQIAMSFQIDDFLVFEQRDENFTECISGNGSGQPEEVFFDVQIVSDSKRRAIAIKQAFQAVVRKLNGGCVADPCEAIMPQPMCEISVCNAYVTGASEDTQRLTSASEFGLSAFDLDLVISPQWINQN